MTIRVHALEESSIYEPDGDCYAPQVVLTGAYRGFEGHMLNGHMLPFTDGDVCSTFEEFHVRMGSRERAIETMKRYYRAFYDTEMHYHYTSGYSQSDWGHSFVFVTPEWLRDTGALMEETLVDESHNDFCAWLWGDVYEVFDDEDDEGEECPMIVYGMDEAMKYGEITYPTHHTYTTYDYND